MLSVFLKAFIMFQLVDARRKTQRMPCIVDARVLMDHRPSISCKICDITPDGAQLVADHEIEAPNKILVLIPAIAEVWAAQIRWRRGLSLGIKFIHGEADLPALSEGTAPDTFALRLQAAQLTLTAKHLSAR
jgi:hypothetical protein